MPDLLFDLKVEFCFNSNSYINQLSHNVQDMALHFVSLRLIFGGRILSPRRKSSQTSVSIQPGWSLHLHGRQIWKILEVYFPYLRYLLVVSLYILSFIIWFKIFSLSSSFPALRIDTLKDSRTSKLFNKCYFILLTEENSSDLTLIIGSVSKIFNHSPKFSIITSPKDPNIILENQGNSPVVFVPEEGVNCQFLGTCSNFTLQL